MSCTDRLWSHLFIFCHKHKEEVKETWKILTLNHIFFKCTGKNELSYVNISLKNRKEKKTKKACFWILVVFFLNNSRVSLSLTSKKKSKNNFLTCGCSISVSWCLFLQEWSQNETESAPGSWGWNAGGWQPDWLLSPQSQPETVMMN